MSTERRQFNEQMADDIREIRSKMELVARLDERVKHLEAGARTNWWMTYVVTPLLMLGHLIAKRLGANV